MQLQVPLFWWFNAADICICCPVAPGNLRSSQRQWCRKASLGEYDDMVNMVSMRFLCEELERITQSVLPHSGWGRKNFRHINDILATSTTLPIFFSSPFCFQGFSQHFSQKTTKQNPPHGNQPTKNSNFGAFGVQHPVSGPRVKTWQQMTSPSCQRSPYLWHQVCGGFWEKLGDFGWITLIVQKGWKGMKRDEKGKKLLKEGIISKTTFYRESMYRVYAYSIHIHV